MEHPLGMKVLAGFIDTSPYQVLKFIGKLMNITNYTVQWLCKLTIIMFQAPLITEL
jgi:hypothetical protein